VAMVALLSGMYRNSQRMVQSGWLIYLASQCHWEASTNLGEASKAVANCVYEAKQYVQQQACVGRTKQAFTRKYRRLQSKNVKLGYGLRPHP